jgi:hypothetical protein
VDQEEVKTILDEAKEIIHGERNRSYGHPRDNFANIADLWNGYLSILGRERGMAVGGTRVIAFTPTDIAILNILQKVARLACNPKHRDTVVDIAGYAGTIERLWEPE